MHRLGAEPVGDEDLHVGHLRRQFRDHVVRRLRAPDRGWLRCACLFSADVLTLRKSMPARRSGVELRIRWLRGRCEVRLDRARYLFRRPRASALEAIGGGRARATARTRRPSRRFADCPSSARALLPRLRRARKCRARWPTPEIPAPASGRGSRAASDRRGRWCRNRPACGRC